MFRDQYHCSFIEVTNYLSEKNKSMHDNDEPDNQPKKKRFVRTTKVQKI